MRAVRSLTHGGLGMAAYAIMRCKKLASKGSVASSLKHCFRDRDTPNADADRTPDNIHLGASSTDEAMGKLREMLPAKHRKDAVLAVEYLMTASPEWWKQASHAKQQDFFKQSYDWLAKKYGSDRIIVATIHQDETSPHLSAFVVPLTKDGRLSAKEFIGGRSQMSSDQSTYADAVRHLGLDRGLKGSKATHQTIRSYYAALREGDKNVPQISAEDLRPNVVKKGFLSSVTETPEAVAERLNAKLMQSLAPIAESAAMARSVASRSKELQAQALEQQQQLGKFKQMFANLSKKQVQEVLELARSHQERNKMATAKTVERGPQPAQSVERGPER